MSGFCLACNNIFFVYQIYQIIDSIIIYQNEYISSIKIYFLFGKSQLGQLLQME